MLSLEDQAPPEAVTSLQPRRPNGAGLLRPRPSVSRGSTASRWLATTAVTAWASTGAPGHGPKPPTARKASGAASPPHCAAAAPPRSVRPAGPPTRFRRRPARAGQRRRRTRAPHAKRQLGHRRGPLLIKVVTAQAGERMVVASPAAPVIQRQHKRLARSNSSSCPWLSVRPVTASHSRPHSRSSTPMFPVGTGRPPRAGGPAPPPLGNPAHNDRCRRTSRRTLPDRSAAATTARPAASRPPTPR